MVVNSMINGDGYERGEDGDGHEHGNGDSGCDDDVYKKIFTAEYKTYIQHAMIRNIHTHTHNHNQSSSLDQSNCVRKRQINKAC